MDRRGALPFGVITLAVKKPAGSVGNGVTAFVMAVRPRASEGCQRNDHQVWKFFFAARIVETKIFQITERRRFDEKIRCGQQLGESLAIGFAYEIDNDAALIGVGVYESETALTMFDIAGERRQQTIRIAAGRLHFDHIGAEVGEPAGRVGRGNVAKLNDPEMAK